MKKIILGGAASLLALSVISGCNDKEEGKEKESVKVTAQEDKGEKDKEKVDEKKEDEKIENASFKILETISQFGGGTFDLNQKVGNSGSFYITEDDRGRVYLTVNDTVISGTKEKWQSVSQEFNSTNGQYPRGGYFFEKNNDEITLARFNFEDVNNLSQLRQTVPEGDRGTVWLVNTSLGEGIITSRGDTYALNVFNYGEIEYKDEKGIMPIPQHLTESTMYIDTDRGKMYFVDYHTKSIRQLDLNTGKPLFVNGDLKEIEGNSSGSTSIIGDSNGNLYVIYSGEKVTVSLYNSNLDLVVDEFEVPVKNPEKIAVSMVNNELHIWDMYSYEMDQTIELVRIQTPMVLKDYGDTGDKESKEKKQLVQGVLEALKNHDEKSFRSFLVNDFGEEQKELTVKGFFRDDFPDFEILDVVKSGNEPTFSALPKGSITETYDVAVNIKEKIETGDYPFGNTVIPVTLYKGKDGWGVFTFFAQ